MSAIRKLLLGAILLASGAAWAGDTPVVVKTEASKGSNSTLNVQTSQGSSCAAPSVGNCGTCSISCPTGQAATCKAGVSVGKESDASCVAPPECACK
jgi:hypothetical protein